MKNLILFLMIPFLFSFQASATVNEYAEADMEYYKGDPSLPHFNIDWNEETNKGVITLRLNWVSFSEERHGTGFDLSQGYMPYLSSPGLPAYCRVSHLEGKLDAPGVKQFNEVKVYIKGESCPNAFYKFKKSSIRISKYNVPYINSEDYTINFQLWIFDAP